MQHKITNRLRRAGVIGAAIGVLSLAAAAPALAAPDCTGSCNGGGTVGASISIPTSFAFTLNTPSITFTGPVGGASNVPAVSYSVTTNDGAGYSVSVSSAGPNLVGVNPADTIPVEDISMWGPAQANAASTNPAPVGAFYPTSLMPTAQVVASSSGPSGAGAGTADNWTDHYAFLGGTAGIYEQANLGNIGAAIPAVASDTYSTTISYVAIAN
jgi:hypothetical protein